MATEHIKVKVDASEIRKLTEEFAKMTAEEKKALKEMGEIELKAKRASKETAGLGSAMKNLGKFVAGAAVAHQFAQMGKEIVRVQASFQKMEATLQNALGSQGAAQQAMDMIIRIAKETPFQVEGLTDSYIKLVNRGIKPTRDEIIQLGDLAATTGKDFDQLTEALLDAMTGEFERLKEFGVKARKEGDVVKFTFKGVTTEVQNTEKAINDYILGLGKMQGVQGAMAAQAATLGGAFSNLEDSTTQLFRALGETDGMLEGLVRDAGRFVQTLTDLVSGQTDWRTEIAETKIQLDAEFGTLKDLVAASEDDVVARAEREELMGMLNRKYGTYLPNLLTEASSVEDIERAYNAVNQALAKNILLKAQAEVRGQAEAEIGTITAGITKIEVLLTKARQARTEFVDVSFGELDKLTRLQDEFGVSALSMKEKFGLGAVDVSTQNLESLKYQLLGQVRVIQDGMKTEVDAVKSLADELGIILNDPLADAEGGDDGGKLGKDALKKIEKAREAFFKLMQNLRDEDFQNTHDWYDNQLRLLDRWQAASEKIITDSSMGEAEKAEARALLENVYGQRRLELRKEWNDKLSEELEETEREQIAIVEEGKLGQLDAELAGNQALLLANELYHEERERQDEEAAERRRRRLGEEMKALGEALGALANQVLQNRAQAANEELQRIQSELGELDGRIAQVSDDELERKNALFAQRELLMEQEEEAQARAKDAYQLQRSIALSTAIIKGALAVQQVFASEAPFPVKLAQVAVIATKTGLQIAQIRQQPENYAEGGVVEGQGFPDGIDTVPANLTKGERVMTVAANRKYGKALEAMHRGEISPDVMNQIAAIKPLSLEQLQAVRPQFIPTAAGQNNAALIEELRGVKSELEQIKSRPTTSVNFDEQGFHVRHEQQGSQRKRMNSKGRIRGYR